MARTIVGNHNPVSVGGNIKSTTLGIFAAVGTGTAATLISGKATFQATADGSHTGTTVVNIEVSNDNTQWILMGTISVTGNSDTDGFSSDANWKYIRAKVDTGNHGDNENDVTVTMVEA